MALKVVVGLGITGLSVVTYLLQQGHQVAVTDSRSNPPNVEHLPSDVTASFGELDVELLCRADEIIISPGLARDTPAIATAINKGIPVIGDIQLLVRAVQALDNPIPIVAITGSNAKSTVTTLVGLMAEQAGKTVAVGGNLGKPALELLDNDPDLLVLELSSFQLESTTDISAKVATVLNMSADHLDRHYTMSAYKEAKHRVFQQAQSCVINRQDDWSIPEQSIAEHMTHISFGLDEPSDHNYGICTDDQGVDWLVKGSEKLLCASDLNIKGQHNLLNALSALALGERVGLPLPAMLTTLREFTGLPHRCEFVANKNNCDYFNDSKGTNVGSTLAAITGLGQSYKSVGEQKNLYLILGGVGKGQDFAPLVDAVARYVKKVLLIGEDAPIIAQALAQHGLDKTDSSQAISIAHVETLSCAVQHFTEEAPHNSVLLLSPACASFDQFTSYTARGDAFVDLVQSITN